LRINRQNSAVFDSDEGAWCAGSGTLFAGGVVPGGWILTQGDPTDHALAAIASILDHPEFPPQPEKFAAEDIPLAPERSSADGYQKIGPGPMVEIRFKWTVRRGDDGYYVDETIGDNSTPVMTGPMSGDSAVKFVDDRESEARRQFDALRSEMAGRAAANFVLNDSET
jgi:hypothetical protein